MNRTGVNGDCGMSGAVYLSCVVPCHNEQEGLAELHCRLDAAARAVGKPFEIILVDDGSIDATWRALRELAASHVEVTAVKISRNFGQQAALATGLSLARGERVLLLDADLQDPPELLPELMRAMDDGADVVHARRRDRAGEPLFKLFSAAAFYRVLKWLSDTRIACDSGEFRLLNRRVADVLIALPERRRLLRGMAAWVGFRQATVTYDRAARVRGETKFTIAKMFGLATDAITSFSVRPLRLATWMAAACFTVSLAAVGDLIWTAWRSQAPTGWCSTLAIVAGFSAMQLLAIGIIGEYLGRLYEQSLGRPLFLIEEVNRASEVSQGPMCPTETATNAQAAFPPRKLPVDTR